MDLYLSNLTNSMFWFIGHRNKDMREWKTYEINDVESIRLFGSLPS